MPPVIPRFAEVGTLVGATEVVSGLSFANLAGVLFMWNPGVTAEDTFNPDMHIGFGAFDGTNQFGSYIWALDGDSVSPPGSGGLLNTHVLNSHTAFGKAAAVSLDASGFTIDWTEAPISGQIVYWMALNADVFEMAVGVITLPNGGDVSISGLGFNPSSLLLNYALGNQFGFGCAARNGDPDSSVTDNQEAAAGAQFALLTASSSDAYSFLEGAYVAESVMHVADSTQIAPDPEAYRVDTWDSGGVTLTTQSTGGAGAVSCGYVATLPTISGSSAMPDGRVYVGYRDTPSGGPPVTETQDMRAVVDAYFEGERIRPACAVFCCPNFANGVGDFGIGLGFADDELNQRHCWTANAYLDSPSECESYSDPDVAVAFRYPESDEILAEGEITSWNKFGYTIEWPSFLDNTGTPFGEANRYFFHLWGTAGGNLHLLPLTGAGYA